MYISKIEIKNIRCFKHLEIDFEKDSNSVLWTVILGDNSVGKTCLLRSIALGLCDESSAAALMKEIKGDFLRKGVSRVNKGFIKITLNNNGVYHTIKTNITRISLHYPEKVSQEIDNEDTFPWDDIFICGYGPHRALFADEGYDKYSSLEAVYTLFNYHSPLQKSELIYRRQNSKMQALIQKKLLNVLMLDEKKYSIKLTNRGMDFHGPWGASPLESLSDGYRSTVQWLIDFMGWLIYSNRLDTNAIPSGIVLIDELEQHLHPKWQRSIVNLLKEQFPNIQFIITTHSPLISSSIGDLTSNKDDNLLHLSRDAKNIITLQQLDTLKGLSIDQVLASKAFDYLIDDDPDIERMLSEASELAGKGSKRTNDENIRYEEVKNIFKQVMRPKGETNVEREVRNDIYKEIRSEAAKLEQLLFKHD